MPSLEHSNVHLARVHSPDLCQGRPCPIHNLTEHSMRSFPQHFRWDRGVMERICSHGVGHPDPDDLPYQIERETNRMQAQGPDGLPRGYYESMAEDLVSIHGCDGCCSERD